MDVKAIREAIEACGEECTCDVDHVCHKHIKINRAMIVIDILSTIDPEAIRAEARAEALREAKGKLAASERLLTTRYRSDYEEGFGDALSEAQDIILADEPKEREGRDGWLRWHCKHCASEFNDSFMEYYCDDDAGEGDYVGECPVCGSRNLITACSHIKEAKE